MRAYLIRRLAQAVLVVFGVTVLTFVMLHILPGGAARAVLGPKATPLQVRTFVDQYGLNRPLIVQYGKWISQLVHGNLGYSYKLNQSVDSLLAQDIPKTLLLTGSAAVVALLFGLPIGMLQALRRNRAIDHAFTGTAFVFYAMPPFFLGLLLVLLFSVRLHLLPPEAPQAATIGGIITDPRALVLPVATLAATSVAVFSRYMRSSTIDVLLQDFIRTCKAKGLSEGRVLTRHVVRNALMPIVTLLGVSLPVVLSGSLITEAVFNYPGMGLLFWNAAQDRDFPVLLGVTVVVSIATVVGSLLADLCYAVLDPRVRYAAR